MDIDKQRMITTSILRLVFSLTSLVDTSDIFEVGHLSFFCCWFLMQFVDNFGFLTPQSYLVFSCIFVLEFDVNFLNSFFPYCLFFSFCSKKHFFLQICLFGAEI